MSDTIRERAEELANRHYVEIAFRDRTTDGDYVYVAYTPELDGCVAQGDTLAEAKENLQFFRIDYIEHLLVNNLPIPNPSWMVTQTQRNEAIKLDSLVLQRVSQAEGRDQVSKISIKVENDAMVPA